MLENTVFEKGVSRYGFFGARITKFEIIFWFYEFVHTTKLVVTGFGGWFFRAVALRMGINAGRLAIRAHVFRQNGADHVTFGVLQIM